MNESNGNYNGYNDYNRYNEGGGDNRYPNVGRSGSDSANRYEEYRFSSAHIPPQNGGKDKKNGGGFFKKAAAAVVLGALFGVFAGGGLYVTNMLTGMDRKVAEATAPQEEPVRELPERETAQETAPVKQEETVTPSANMAVVTTERIGDVSEVAESVMPSIVAITNDYTSTQQGFFGERYTMENTSAGSGIIVGKNDKELLVATNQHVVSSADKLKVQFIDGEEADASLKGSDESTDLAVIAVSLDSLQDKTLEKIKVATLGDSDSLKVGQATIAIGNALGYGQSVTTGVVSALNREVTLSNGTHELIQTDAAINPGNSGGALLDINGNVIGINEAKLANSEVEGMGYAIPISTAKPVIEQLMSKETKAKAEDSNRGYLGISGVNVTADIAEQYNMPQGVYIAKIFAGLAADNAGLEKGDIITSFDGQSVQTMEQLQDIIKYYEAGTEVEVKVQTPREDDYGYDEKTVTVTLTRNTDQASSQQQQSGQQGGEGSEGGLGNGNGGNSGNGGSSEFGIGNGGNGGSYFYGGDLGDLFRNFW